MEKWPRAIQAQSWFRLNNRLFPASFWQWFTDRRIHHRHEAISRHETSTISTSQRGERQKKKENSVETGSGAAPACWEARTGWEAVNRRRRRERDLRRDRRIKSLHLILCSATLKGGLQDNTFQRLEAPSKHDISSAQNRLERCMMSSYDSLVLRTCAYSSRPLNPMIRNIAETCCHRCDL